LEEAFNERISFIRFSGFSLSNALPDHSTICQFRNALLELNLFERLFTESNKQLEEQRILVKESNGAIADTTALEKLLTNLHLPNECPVCADKGYASRKNRSILTDRPWLRRRNHAQGSQKKTPSPSFNGS
jgi:IS5 family transposase